MNIFKFIQKKEKGLPGSAFNNEKLVQGLPGSAFRTRKTTTGFTLVELLVVISIISFLSSIVLASMQTARDKAIATKIAEDMRQYKIAAEMYYGDNGSYTFTFASNNINKDVLADKNSTRIIQDFNLFSAKIANAQTIPPACDLFNIIGNNLVAAKYLSAVPKHPRQDYTKNICYKAATSSDGTYFAAYAETPQTVLIGGVYTPKNIGFVAGDASIPNLNKIRTTPDITYLRTISNNPIISIADIADAVLGITNGSRGTYGSSEGSGSSGGFTFGGDPVGTTPSTPLYPCGVDGVLLPSGVCKVPPTGCRVGDVGPCQYYPTIPDSAYSYICPVDQVFLQNGLQNTINGTCSPIISCPTVVGIHYDPVTNTCVDETPTPPPSGEAF